MLGICDDDYTAYCVDEAAAWLLSRKEPPKYGGDSSGRPALNGNAKVLAALAKLGAVEMKQPKGSQPMDSR